MSDHPPHPPTYQWGNWCLVPQECFLKEHMDGLNLLGKVYGSIGRGYRFSPFKEALPLSLEDMYEIVCILSKFQHYLRVIQAKDDIPDLLLTKRNVNNDQA